ncbi:DUF916 domain-containing protein [Weissella cibaria]|uniref:DUF916 domain-containing protein n=1 Tax=Weissella cibaria TaxID=137591 RepID=UPI000BFFE2BA|nr:DUF916 domain-containing protein [Weissella cibaria]
MMRRLLGIVIGLLMLGTVTVTAHADNALTVKLTTPTAQRQESANKGYADLLTEKGDTTKLTFTLQNSSDAPINVDVTPGTAGTSDNGAVVYGTQNWGENHFVNLPARMEQLITPEAKTVTVPAKGSASTSVSVKTPDNGISGVLAGGVSFVQQQQTNTTDSKTMFQSEVGYTVAVLNRTTNAILVPNLSIGDVDATLVNNQATVGIQMLNNTQTFLNGLYVMATITGPQGVYLQRNASNMQMAPNSQMQFNVWSNGQQLVAGDYDVQVDAYYGLKDNLRFDAPNGKRYTYHTRGQTKLHVSTKQSKTLTADDALLQQRFAMPWWGWLLLAIIVGGLIGGILYAVLRRRTVNYLFVLADGQIIDRGSVRMRRFEKRSVALPSGFVTQTTAKTGVVLAANQVENTFVLTENSNLSANVNKL